jgi:hypothetical protein
MLIGVAAAVIACLGYGAASVLQASAAHGTAAPANAARGPSLRSTVNAMLAPAFLLGMALDAVGFTGSAVSARLIPLFLSQTIISANLAVTAVLGVVVLGVRLSPREIAAVIGVVISLVVLGLTAGEAGEGSAAHAVHWGVLFTAVLILLIGVGLLRLLGARGAVAAGLVAGTLFGAVAVAVRVVDGVAPFRLDALLADPAAWTIPMAGVGGFYLFTVALQLGSVTGAAAALVVGETIVPGIVGVVLLGDTARSGWAWLVVLAFVGAVAGAVTLAVSGAHQSQQTSAA